MPCFGGFQSRWPLEAVDYLSAWSAAGRLKSLRRAELPVDAVELARFLIGKVVVRDLEFVRLIGRIVETEA
jgi:hypothetical protein